LLVAVTVTAAMLTPCPPAEISQPGDDAVHAASHAHAREAADTAPPIPLVDGWCSRPAAPTAHLAEACPCGCGDRSAVAGSSLGWMLLSYSGDVLDPPPDPSFSRTPMLQGDPPLVPIEHVPIA
jgi:hypothetical protein